MQVDSDRNILERWLGWKGWRWVIWICGIVLVCLQIEYRVLDRDEGFYLYGAWRVFQGEVPYLDFFYPQAPYMPFVYAPMVGLFEDGIFGGRALSAVFSIGLAVLCATWVHRRSGDRRLGLLAGGMMLFGNLGLYWHGAVKTYALSDLLFLGGFILLMTAFRATRSSKVFLPCLLSGILFGLSFHVRLVLAGAVVYLLLLAVLAPGWSRFRRFLGLSLGIVTASVPAFLLFMQDPQQYWFQNLTFHVSARLPYDWGYFAVQKVTGLGEYLSNPDILVSMVLCAAGMWGLSRKELDLPLDFQRDVWMGIGLAGVLFATYLTAPPLLPQYLVQLSPFLVLGAVAGVAVILKEARGSSGAVIALIFLLVYGGWGVGKTVGRVAERQDMAPASGMKTVREVGRYLEDHVPDNEQVLTYWPGYLAAGKRDGLENTEFGRPSFRLEWRNPPEVLHEAGLKTEAEFERLIEDQVPTVVVAGFDTPPGAILLLEKHYQLSKKIGEVGIFVRP